MWLNDCVEVVGTKGRRNVSSCEANTTHRYLKQGNFISISKCLTGRGKAESEQTYQHNAVNEEKQEGPTQK